MKRERHFLCIILLTMFITKTRAQKVNSTSCNRNCGGISIPYPFGIGPKDCYLNDWYKVICNTTTSSKSPAPFLPKINKELVSITLRNRLDDYYRIQIKSPVTSSGCSKKQENETSLLLNLTGIGSPYYITKRNRLVSVGCDSKALITNIESRTTGCESSCEGEDKSRLDKLCSGYRCCQAEIQAKRPQVIGVSLSGSSNTSQGQNCNVAFLTYESYSLDNVTEAEEFYSKGFSVVELGYFFDSRVTNPVGCNNWTEGGSFLEFRRCGCEYGYISGFGYSDCFCNNINNGYRGNPYAPGGCIDIDECVEEKGICKEKMCVNLDGGYRCDIIKITTEKTKPWIQGLILGFALLLLVLVIWGLIMFVKRRRKIIKKKKFFKRNGGLLLKQQLSTKEGGSVETSKIFSSKELEKATDNFNKDRILGQGGQGTVYKGMLVNGQIVAVKRSKVLDEDKVEEFINEVGVLSQINHRNIVKLMGCCLETEVPILIYEYIPNGDLYKRLHDDSDDFTLTWEVRLRIAVEIAGALAYLHSAASTPVYHRDVKTTNILLDDKYRAKVSDFGTSRSINIDQTHLTTLVAGTFGYLDPEYFQTSQFTDKSDVYSFGIVLVELITGEKPFSVMRPEEHRGLASHFIEAMKQDTVLDIIDPRIKEDCKVEQVLAVAKLARRCLSLKGKKRPNMREVSSVLQRIRSSAEDLEVQIEEEGEDEETDMVINIDDSWSVDMTAPASLFDLSPTLDAEPLVPHRTWSL